MIPTSSIMRKRTPPSYTAVPIDEPETTPLQKDSSESTRCRRFLLGWIIMSLLVLLVMAHIAVSHIRSDPNYLVRFKTGPPRSLHDLLLAWDGYDLYLPTWMQKRVDQRVATDQNLCFVHVGKVRTNTSGKMRNVSTPHEYFFVGSFFLYLACMVGVIDGGYQ